MADRRDTEQRDAGTRAYETWALVFGSGAVVLALAVLGLQIAFTQLRVVAHWLTFVALAALLLEGVLIAGLGYVAARSGPTTHGLLAWFPSLRQESAVLIFLGVILSTFALVVLVSHTITDLLAYMFMGALVGGGGMLIVVRLQAKWSEPDHAPSPPDANQDE